MHCGVRIWHFVVEIFILVPYTVMVVVLHIVENSQVVVDVASPVKVLRKEIESYVVPMRGLDLICWKLFMPEILWER